MTLVDDIREAWSWLGVEPARVVRVNRFGNVVFADAQDRHWRLCPEELECTCIAGSAPEFARLAADEEFAEDWDMAALADPAEERFGRQPAGRCFCFKIPGVLGGRYELDNVGTIALSELVRFSGDVARQIRDLPDGARVQLKLTE
jgi:hypothetical protein